jgi:diguanylate cyclase (GGDEF)-like protein
MNNLTIFATSMFLNAFCALLLVLVVLIKSKMKYTNILAVFYICTVIWAIGLAGETISPNKMIATICVNTLLVGAVFIPAVHLHFVLSFTEKLRERKKILIISYISAGIILILNFMGLLVDDIRPIYYFNFYVKPKPAYLLFLAYFGACVSYSLFELYIEHKKTTVVRKNQIQYFFWSIAIGYIGGSATFLPKYGFSIPPYLPALYLIHPIAIAYAVMAYHMIGIRAALGKILSPLISFVFIVTILGFIKINITSQNIAVISLLGAFLFYVLFNIFNWIIKRWIPQKNYDQLIFDHIQNMLASDSLDNVFKNTIKILEDKDSPYPINGAFLLQNLESNNYSVHASFGSNVNETLNISFNSPLLKIVRSEYDRNKELSVFSKDDLYKKHHNSALIEEINQFPFQMFIPLVSHTKENRTIILGFFGFGESQISEIYDKKDYDFFKKIAVQTTQAIIQVEAREVIEQEKMIKFKDTIQQDIRNTTKTLTQIKDIETFSEELISAFRKETQASFVYFFILNPDKKIFELKGFHGQEQKDNIPNFFAGNSPLIEILKEQSTPVLFKNLQVWAEAKTENLVLAVKEASILNATVFIPIKLEKLLGFLALGERQDNIEYRQNEWTIFDMLSSVAAISIQNMLFAEDIVKDKLTGLYNQGYISVLVKQSIRHSINSGHPVTILFLDIDNFKKCNDTYGHDVGNEVLQRTTNDIRNVLRPEDIAGRAGGEEIIVILPNTNKENSKVVADKIKNQINENPLNTLHVTISGGSVTFIPSQDKNDKILYDAYKISQKIIKLADGMMYQAKKAGKNRFCFGKDYCQNEETSLFIVSEENPNILNIVKYFKYAEYKTELFLNDMDISKSLDTLNPIAVLIYPDELKKLDLCLLINNLHKKNINNIAVLTSKSEIKDKISDLEVSRIFWDSTKPQEIEDWLKKLE